MDGVYQIGDIVLGNWKLVRKIGEGSYGRVYEAEREDFGVTYQSAIKIITIPQSQSEVSDARSEGMDEESVTAYFKSFVGELVQEIVLMSRLKGHSNIVSYEDHVVLPHKNGVGWDIMIRMELLTPLMTYAQQHPLTRDDVIRLGREVCSALELCEQEHIVHRDIKPENIFVSRSGDFKLGDFGIARTVEKTTGGLSKKGTYTYMAPEVYKEQPYNANVDIYSLGIVMYRLLNENRAPFLPPPPQPILYNDRENALAKRMSGENLPAPSHSDELLGRVVLKACAYRPEDRYSRPTEMKNDLATAGRGQAPLVPEEEEKTEAVFDVTAKAAPAADFAEEKTESIFEAGPAAPEIKAAPAADFAEEKTESVFKAGPAAPEIKAASAGDFAEEKTESVFEARPAAPRAETAPKVEAEPEPRSEKGKKNRLPLILGAAAAVMAVVALVMGGGGSDEPQSGGSTGGDVSLSEPTAPPSDSSTGADTSLPEPAAPQETEETEKAEILTDLSNAMLLGKYTINSFHPPESTFGEYTVDVSAFQEGMEYMTLNNTAHDWINGVELSVIPYCVTFHTAEYVGETDLSWSQSGEAQRIDREDYLYAYFDHCDRSGEEQCIIALARVEGDKLLVYLRYGVDENGGVFIQGGPDLEYQISFKGKDLCLEREGKKIEMVPHFFCDHVDHPRLEGALSPGQEAWQNIGYIDLQQKVANEVNHHDNVWLADGRKAVDSVIELSGNNTITISYQESEDDARRVTLTAQYLSCGTDSGNFYYGMIIIDDGKYYFYQSEWDDWYERMESSS